MGSLASAAIANLYMEEFEEWVVTTANIRSGSDM